MSMIDNSDLLKEAEHEKKLMSAIKRMEKAAKEIELMGYEIYIASHGSLNVMNVESREDKFDQNRIVASCHLVATDCGDW